VNPGPATFTTISAPLARPEIFPEAPRVASTAYPSIQVDSNLLFARDENIYSSGGVTVGIDLA
jgi:hypothetical protein